MKGVTKFHTCPSRTVPSFHTHTCIYIYICIREEEEYGIINGIRRNCFTENGFVFRKMFVRSVFWMKVMANATAKIKARELAVRSRARLCGLESTNLRDDGRSWLIRLRGCADLAVSFGCRRNGCRWGWTSRKGQLLRHENNTSILLPDLRFHNFCANCNAQRGCRRPFEALTR